MENFLLLLNTVATTHMYLHLIVDACNYYISACKNISIEENAIGQCWSRTRTKNLTFHKKLKLYVKLIQN